MSEGKIAAAPISMAERQLCHHALGWWLAAWLLFCFPPHTAQAACKAQPVARVKLEHSPIGPIIELGVNGRAARFLLDTGASRSEITTTAIARLHLPRDHWSSTTIHGVGGYQHFPDADIASLSLQGIALHRNRMDHDLTLAVGNLPQLAARNIDGLLGADILSAYDLDLDLSANTLSLYAGMPCQDSAPSFIAMQNSVPAIQPLRQWLLIPVRVDHTVLLGLLDTGSGVTVVTASGMRRLGKVADFLPGDPRRDLSGVGSGHVPIWEHRYASYQIGHERLASPMLWTGMIKIAPIIQIVIGRDWMHSHHIWISYSTNRVYFDRAASP